MNKFVSVFQFLLPSPLRLLIWQGLGAKARAIPTDPSSRQPSTLRYNSNCQYACRTAKSRPSSPHWDSIAARGEHFHGRIRYTHPMDERPDRVEFFGRAGKCGISMGDLGGFIPDKTFFLWYQDEAQRLCFPTSYIPSCI
jgi:hypothetical protein